MAVKKGYIAVLLMAIFAVMLSSCDSTGCHENRSSIPQAALYAYNAPTSPVSADSISVYGVGQWKDSLLLDCAMGVSTFKIPFRNDADTTQYVIHYDAKSVASDRYNDTLTFIYRRHPYFISGDCGVVYNYYIDTFRYTTNMLDSAALMTKEVNNEEQETIRLYYYVAQ